MYVCIYAHTKHTYISYRSNKMICVTFKLFSNIRRAVYLTLFNSSNKRLLLDVMKTLNKAVPCFLKDN